MVVKDKDSEIHPSIELAGDVLEEHVDNEGGLTGFMVFGLTFLLVDFDKVLEEGALDDDDSYERLTFEVFSFVGDVKDVDF